MEEILKQLGIEETEDFEVIKEKLEQKQIEYLDRLDVVNDEVRRTKLKETLKEIENALSMVSWSVEKMLNKGLVPDTDRDRNRGINAGMEALKGNPQGSELNVKELGTASGTASGTAMPSGGVMPSGGASGAAMPSGATSVISPKLQRAFICLESNDWSKADALLEDVLNEDPTNSKAYVGKLMAKLHISKENKIREQETPLSDNQNYKLAVKYADSSYANILRGYNDYIERTITYKAALKSMLNADKEPDYVKAAEEFERLGEFQDSFLKAKECRDTVKRLNEAEQERKLKFLEGQYNTVIGKISKQELDSTLDAIEILKISEMRNYKDAPQLLQQCEKVLKDQKYEKALEEMSYNSFGTAIELFAELGDYKDAKSKKEECERTVQAREKQERNKSLVKKYTSKIAIDVLLGAIVCTPIVYFSNHLNFFGITVPLVLLIMIGLLGGPFLSVFTFIATAAVVNGVDDGGISWDNYINADLAFILIASLIPYFIYIISKRRFEVPHMIAFALLMLVGKAAAYGIIGLIINNIFYGGGIDIYFTDYLIKYSINTNNICIIVLGVFILKYNYSKKRQ